MSQHDEKDRERLGKLVALAKRGEGGEKTTALRMVANLCVKLELNFEDVMREEESRAEYHIDCSAADYRLLLHIVIAYAYDGDGTGDFGMGHAGRRRRIFFTTTKAQYVETVHAWTVLSRQYRKEKKRMRDALWHAFLTKHDLYAKKTVKDDKPPELTEEELRARRMGGALANGLEDADIRKTLPAAR